MQEPAGGDQSVSEGGAEVVIWEDACWAREREVSYRMGGRVHDPRARRRGQQPWGVKRDLRRRCVSHTALASPAQPQLG